LKMSHAQTKIKCIAECILKLACCLMAGAIAGCFTKALDAGTQLSYQSIRSPGYDAQWFMKTLVALIPRNEWIIVLAISIWLVLFNWLYNFFSGRQRLLFSTLPLILLSCILFASAVEWIKHHFIILGGTPPESLESKAFTIAFGLYAIMLSLSRGKIATRGLSPYASN
jgi:hypothetical protein